MYRIVRKEALKPTVILYEIEAPMVAKKAEPGQFIILRVDENGERIPITIHDYDREKGTVTIIVQTVGATSTRISPSQRKRATKKTWLSPCRAVCGTAIWKRRGRTKETSHE